jgi:hypothetical protein
LRAASRCKVKLLLNEEESGKLAEAVRGRGNRSLIILESIQARLHAPNLPGLQRKRTRVVHFWLPTEIMEEVRQLALDLRVSQQNLIRHLLFTYLATAPWKPTSADALDRPDFPEAV